MKWTRTCAVKRWRQSRFHQIARLAAHISRQFGRWLFSWNFFHWPILWMIGPTSIWLQRTFWIIHSLRHWSFWVIHSLKHWCVSSDKTNGEREMVWTHHEHWFGITTAFLLWSSRLYSVERVKMTYFFSFPTSENLHNMFFSWSNYKWFLKSRIRDFNFHGRARSCIYIFLIGNQNFL